MKITYLNQKNRNYMRYSCLWLMLIFLVPVWSQPGVQNVTAVGVGSIYQGDLALARDRALDDALRKAVEQALGTWLQSETVVQNYMLVEDNILSWSSGYVKKYTIASEMRKPGDVYEVTVNATVETGALTRDRDQVQNLIDKAGNPRIMIIFNEQNIGESYNRYHFFQVDMTQAETTLMEKFIDQGFQIVDPATVRESVKREQAIAALEGNDKAAAALGLQLDADVVVTGKAVASVASTQMKILGDMKSCQANLTARVVKADVGTVIATGSENAAYPHIDEITGGNEAIKKASNKLADQLIKKILDKWRQEFYNKTTIKLRLTGVESASDLSNFKSELSTYFRGIKNVRQRNFLAGTAELDVEITGNADQLARELERKSMDEFKVRVTRTTANQINLTLAKTAKPSQAVPDTSTQY
ncbi:flagellar assembly protein T N-terminal domain-containing protein [candidate division KSB1 bacterium]|nr:flagellar assembly protein T N-terminal domain-containing protein [candidate division KSB1 bacterium]